MNLVPTPLQPQRPGLSALRRQIARLEKAPLPAMAEGDETPAFPWGIPSIDRHLPGNGLAWGALHEFAGAGLDREEASLAAGIVARLLGRGETGRPGHMLWIARQRDLYARALPAAGCDPARLLHLAIRRNEDALWAMEEALRCASLRAVIGEIANLDLTQSRRLQLAAEKSGVPAFIIRRGRAQTARARDWMAEPIAAVTRWRIHPAPSLGIDLPAGRQPLPGKARWQVELWRCRGGNPGTWLLEEQHHGWREATLPLPLAAAMADRSLAAAPDEDADGNDHAPRRRTG